MVGKEHACVVPRTANLRNSWRTWHNKRRTNRMLHVVCERRVTARHYPPPHHKNRLERIAVHVSALGSFWLYPELNSFASATGAESMLVLQSEKTLLPYACDEYARTNFLIRRLCHMNQKMYGTFTRCFGDLADWERFIRTCDFSLGMRIHGTILALKNGIPAILIKQDERTKEMAEMFSIPALSISEFQAQAKSPSAIIDSADFNAMNKRYPVLLQKYIEFLKGNGLEPGFRNFVPSPGYDIGAEWRADESLLAQAKAFLTSSKFSADALSRRIRRKV